MHLQASTINSLAFKRALALSLLLLTACSRVPTRPASAPALQDLLLQQNQLQLDLKQKPDKPISDMQDMPPPQPPRSISTLPTAQQAQAAMQLYTDAIQYAGKCWVTRDDLIRWINQQ
jgi:hypothetical protein